MSSCGNDALILVAVLKNTGVHHTCTAPPLDKNINFTLFVKLTDIHTTDRKRTNNLKTKCSSSTFVLTVKPLLNHLTQYLPDMFTSL